MTKDRILIFLIGGLVLFIIGHVIFTSGLARRNMKLKSEIDILSGQNKELKKLISAKQDSLKFQTHISDSLQKAFSDFITRAEESKHEFNKTLNEKVHAVLNASDSAAISTLARYLERERSSVNQ